MNWLTRLAAKHLSRKARQQRKAIRENANAMRAYFGLEGRV